MKLKNILLCSTLVCSLTVGSEITKEYIHHEPIAFAKTVSSNDSKQELQNVILNDKYSNDDYEEAIQTFVDDSVVDQSAYQQSNDAKIQDSDTTYMKQMKHIDGMEDRLDKILKKEKPKLTGQDYKTLKKYFEALKDYLNAGESYGKEIATDRDNDDKGIDGLRQNTNDLNTSWINMYNKLTGKNDQPQTLNKLGSNNSNSQNDDVDTNTDTDDDD